MAPRAAAAAPVARAGAYAAVDCIPAQWGVILGDLSDFWPAPHSNHQSGAEDAKHGRTTGLRNA